MIWLSILISVGACLTGTPLANKVITLSLVADTGLCRSCLICSAGRRWPAPEAPLDADGA